MTPYIIKAVQEMKLEVENVNDRTKPNSFRDSLLNWFKDTGNGITEFVASILRAKDKLCIGEGANEVCVTKDELLQMKNNSDHTDSATTTTSNVTQSPSGTDNTSGASSDMTGGDANGTSGGSSTSGDTGTTTPPDSSTTPPDTASGNSTSTPSVSPTPSDSTTSATPSSDTTNDNTTVNTTTNTNG